MDIADGGEPVRALEIDDWPRSGLPWIAFWLKELITWGTLEPVAAFLLVRGAAIDRSQAEQDAQLYYDELPQDIEPNDALDPRAIRKWVDSRRVLPEEAVAVRQFVIRCQLVRPPADYRQPRLIVLPVEVNGQLGWVDPAGYLVARSRKPRAWPNDTSMFEFALDIANTSIEGKPYLQHQ